MEKAIRLSTLLGMVILLGACAEDDIIKNYNPKDYVGNEIVFGVSTASGSKTRTVYGEHSETDKKVEVNWIGGDMLMIACPQAAGTRLAHYQVTTETEADDSTKLDNYSETSIRKADGETVSLQWGSEESHEFFAVYPSSEKEGMAQSANGDNPYVTMDDEGFSGYLPLDQSVPADNITEDSDGNIIVSPNMDIAYMKAYNEGVTPGNAVSLEFTSLNTVLQFQIHRGDILNNLDVGDIKIHGASLISNSGKAICGSFNYKFKTGVTTSSESSDYSRVTISLPEAKILTKNNFCDLTFFILPTYTNEEGSDLKLQVMYSVDSNPQVKTATIKANIVTSQKHLFKNVKLPTIDSKITGSNWFSAIADNVYLNQLSIPVAGGVFSENASSEYHKQQTETYTTLWDMGVRGFELATVAVADMYDDNSDAEHLGDCSIIIGQKPLTTTFGEAFETLLGKLADNPEEVLVVFCKYEADDGGMNSQLYINDLCNYLNTLLGKTFTGDAGGTLTVSESTFKRINSSSTVKDIRGRVAIIVRPGDEDQNREHDVDETTITNLSAGSWDDKTMVIKNWGISYDAWDRRYGSTYARNGAWNNNDASVSQTNVLDHLIYATMDGYGSNAALSSYGYTDKGNNYPTAWPQTVTSDDVMTFSILGGGIAYIQEWARVAKGETLIQAHAGSNGIYGWGATNPVYVKWPDSYEHKKAQIEHLFKKSIATKGTNSTNLFINVLSGYQITSGHKQSYGPHLQNALYKRNNWSTQGLSGNQNVFSGQGQGGNYKALADSLNSYVYDNLSKVAWGDGPYGLVQIDYIGDNATTSGKLVNLIMMNNFKFPLATYQESKEPGSDDNTEGGDDTSTDPNTPAVTFSNDPVDPAGDIY